MSASDQFTQGAEVASGSHNPASVSSIPTPASNFAGHLPADTMRSPAAGACRAGGAGRDPWVDAMLAKAAANKARPAWWFARASTNLWTTGQHAAAVRALRQLSWDGACGPKLSRIVCQEGRKELDQALRSLCIGLVLCRVPLPTC